MNYLIDTDMIIYSFKGHENVNAEFHLRRSSPKSISVVTCGELIYGARTSQHVEKNLARVYRIAEIFPVIPITPAVMDVFGELKVSHQRTGPVLDDMDLLIASTALTHNLILVTNNEKHFSGIKGLDIENWSTESAFKHPEL